MQIKHHLIRKFHESRQAPLWKWAIVILVAIAMPMFFSLVRTTQTEQILQNDAPSQTISEETTNMPGN